MDFCVGFEAVGTANLADGGDFGDRVFVSSVRRHCLAGYPFEERERERKREDRRDLTTLGGFLFTAISLVIPPLLHLVCFKKTLSPGKKQFEYAALAFFFVFMVVSTVFSGIALFSSSS